MSDPDFVGSKGYRDKDQQSRVLYELSSLILNLLWYPPTSVQFSDDTSSRRHPQRPPLTQPTPAGFTSLLLGISLSLMLCGSITFFIGFLLMPWPLGAWLGYGVLRGWDCFDSSDARSRHFFPYAFS
ncbi:hypothetical protein LXL04_011710 [Taraxacum kok-saghyz]